MIILLYNGDQIGVVYSIRGRTSDLNKFRNISSSNISETSKNYAQVSIGYIYFGCYVVSKS